MIPGEYFLKEDAIECNAGKATATVVVVNTGDRPVQVGSHFHFFEINRQLSFERPVALGMRLNIAAGTAVRFEPGEEKKVELVELGGAKKVIGFNNLVNGITNEETIIQSAVQKMQSANFKYHQP